MDISHNVLFILSYPNEFSYWLGLLVFNGHEMSHTSIGYDIFTILIIIIQMVTMITTT